MKIIIVGGGRFIYFLTKAFTSKGHSVTLVNKSREECVDLARRLKATVVHGDGTSPSILEEAGARGSDALIAVTPFDHENMVVCQIGHWEFDIPRVLALIDDPENHELFESLGITSFSATTSVVSMVEQRTEVDEITNLMPMAGGNVNATEIVISGDSPASGIVIRDLPLPQDALIAVIIRDEQPLVPHGDTTIRADDRLVLITTPNNHGPAIRSLTGEDV